MTNIRYEGGLGDMFVEGDYPALAARDVFDADLWGAGSFMENWPWEDEDAE